MFKLITIVLLQVFSKVGRLGFAKHISLKFKTESKNFLYLVFYEFNILFKFMRL